MPTTRQTLLTVVDVSGFSTEVSRHFATASDISTQKQNASVESFVVSVNVFVP